MHKLHSETVHHTTLNNRRIELTLFDPKNKRALGALLPEAFVHQIEALWNGPNSHLLGLGEWELMKAAKRAGRPISPQDHTLRLQFWFEYNGQQESPDYHYPALNMSRVIGKAVAKETFYKHIITDPIKLAWILTPPQNYLNALDLALMTATYRMIEICELPLVDDKGLWDPTTVTKMGRLLENFHRYIRAMNGDIVSPPADGQRPGRRMPDSKISENAPPETADDKAIRLQAEIDRMKADRSEQIGSPGVSSAEES